MTELKQLNKNNYEEIIMINFPQHDAHIIKAIIKQVMEEK